MEKPNVGAKVKAIRVRTWTCTLSIIIALSLYLLINVTWNNEVNIIDLIVLGSLQILTHCLYFPDGEISGQNGETFINNKKAYNTKATAINENRCVGLLREYCRVDLERRRQTYIENECGAIGIDIADLEILRQMPIRAVSRLSKWENNGRLIYFTRSRRKRLKRLIFEPLPIEENSPDTILSAVETNFAHSIKDESISYKVKAYIKKVFLALGVSVFFAYIGYSLKDGFEFAIIVKIFTYITSIFTTAIFSFSQGEVCQKVHKNKFYVDLCNFIDGFNEWLNDVV